MAGSVDAVYHCALAWLGSDEPRAGVEIGVRGGLIHSVTEVEVPTPGAVRLDGVTIPGMANAHSHAFHRALRGHTQTGPGTFWTWRDDMYRLAGVLDPDSYHRLARAVFGEMVLAGITCVGEFHYLHHRPDGGRYGDPNAMGAAIIAAAADAGLRLTLLDTCYLGSGMTAGGALAAPLPEQRRFTDGSVHAWLARVEELEETPTARMGAAIHSVRAVDPASIEAVAGWTRDRHRPLHAHVSEQPAENEQCQAAHGMTPLGLFDACGALSDSFTAIHATHVTDTDIERLAASRSTVCLCPTTERDLADGIAPTAAYRAGGIRLALGSDSHAVIDLFEEARAVELDERLATGSRGNHTIRALLHAATTHGHRALGWPEAGRLAVGAPADFAAVSLRSVRTAGTDVADALAAVVFAAQAADVTDVVIGGVPVVKAGRHRLFDVAAELDTAIRTIRIAAGAVS